MEGIAHLRKEVHRLRKLVNNLRGETSRLQNVVNVILASDDSIALDLTLSQVRSGNYALYRLVGVSADVMGEEGFFKRTTTVVVDDGRNGVIDAVGTYFTRMRIV